ncbi:MAG: ArsR/SmtB family transcription factor [Candidatus Limnocylindrales bacterium]
MLRTTDDIYGLQAAVLRTLASPRRLEIVHLLGRGPLEVHELADELGIGQSNVSAHLAALRSIGIVEPIRLGRGVRYQLTDQAIVVACDMVRDVLGRRLEHLRVMVAGMAAEGAVGTDSCMEAAEPAGIGTR